MKVLLCGGGNAIHVLSAYISAKPDTDVTILSLFPGEAEKLRDAIPEEGIRCINDLGDDVVGKPNAVVKKVILTTLPTFPCCTKEALYSLMQFYSRMIGRRCSRGSGYRHPRPPELRT